MKVPAEFDNRSVGAAGRPTLLSRIVKWGVLKLYRWKGWQITAPDDIPARCVLLGAPHTSNWDFIFFIGATHELGIKPCFMGKRSLFRGPLRRFMYDMGGIPIDRQRRGKYVDQIIPEFDRRTEMALVVAPEGTRSEVPEWRSGFYHIAHGAGVPIVPAWVNNATMKGGLGPKIETSGDFLVDLKRIAEFYNEVLPGHPKLAALNRQVGLMPANVDITDV